MTLTPLDTSSSKPHTYHMVLPADFTQHLGPRERGRPVMIRLSAEDYKKVEAEARKQGLPVATLVKEIVRWALKD